MVGPLPFSAPPPSTAAGATSVAAPARAGCSLQSLPVAELLIDPLVERVTRLAQGMLRTRLALVAFAADDRMWVSPSADLAPEMVEAAAEWAAMTLDADRTLAVVDTLDDPRTRGHPTLGDPSLPRAWVGIPLRNRKSEAFGVLVVVDRPARVFSAVDIALMRELGGIITEHLALRCTTQRLSRTQAVLAQITQNVASSSGHAFFRALVHQLAVTLGVDYAFVAVTDEEQDELRTLASFQRGALAENSSYPLTGTPCAEAATDGFVWCASGARERFSEDPGLIELDVESYAAIALPHGEGRPGGCLGVMSSSAMIEREMIETVLRGFANRTAAELERLRAEAELRETNRRLQERVVASTGDFEVASASLQREIVEHQRTEAALRESEERYALAARGANDGLWDWEITHDRIYYSPRWQQMLGYEDGELSDQPEEWIRRVHPDDLDHLYSTLTAHLEGVSAHFQVEHRMKHRDGSWRWMLTRGLAVRTVSGAAYRMAGSQTDITDRKRAEEQLLRDAFRDTLTNLPNRALFMDRLRHAVELAKRHDEHAYAVLFLDVDRFKLINDSLGHVAGDELLVAIATRLERSLRPEDTVARLGGDEFTILLEDVRNAGDATRVADRVQHALRQPFHVKGQDVFVSASIGIALSSTGYDRAEDVIRDADTAMYRAKARGKARYELFDTQMHATAVALLRLETELRQAIEREEFQLHYQPIASIETGRIVAFEALLRWQHPARGLLMPAEFLGVALETGLILPIGKWGLRAACRQAQEWQSRFGQEPPVAISLNICARQLMQPDLVSQIQSAMEEFHLDSRALLLEITEDMIMENPELAASLFDQLRALHIKLYIDDFGTGYSSLGALHRFPLDTLKIDRSFVAGLDADGSEREIVRTIVTLAHALHMRVVAEGVETREQLEVLRSLGCEHVQGYLLSRPVTGDEATRLLENPPVWLAA